MRRRVLAPLVVGLMLMAMMAFAGLAYPQPQDSPSCGKGIATARGASTGRQGPPPGKGPPTFTRDLPAHYAPPFGGCPPP
jgi:hypothetical protein